MSLIILLMSLKQLGGSEFIQFGRSSLIITTAIAAAVLFFVLNLYVLEFQITGTSSAKLTKFL
jgi:hypothetical protein